MATSSSCTILTTIWPGVTDLTTFWPTALAFTLSVNSRTTSSATSASSSARRTSRMASATSLSVSDPRRVSLSRMPDRRSDRDSNIGPLHCARLCSALIPHSTSSPRRRGPMQPSAMVGSAIGAFASSDLVLSRPRHRQYGDLDSRLRGNDVRTDRSRPRARRAGGRRPSPASRRFLQSRSSRSHDARAPASTRSSTETVGMEHRNVRRERAATCQRYKARASQPREVLCSLSLPGVMPASIGQRCHRPRCQ